MQNVFISGNTEKYYKKKFLYIKFFEQCSVSEISSIIIPRTFYAINGDIFIDLH